jgi:hypothetical protein
MGNRANIIFKSQNGELSPCVYLHWNGGPESIMAFIAEMLRRNWTRQDYAAARFCQIIGEYFSGIGADRRDDGHSLGVFNSPSALDDATIKDLSGNCDNGLYIIEIGNNKAATEVTQYQCYGRKRSLSFSRLNAVFKEEGKRYIEGHQDTPLKKFKSIIEFFLDHDKALRIDTEKAA